MPRNSVSALLQPICCAIKATGDSAVELAGGGTDTVQTAITNWYSGANYHVEQITTADGKVLQDSLVEALVTAMALYAPPALGQLTLPAEYWTALWAVTTGSWH